MTLKRVGTRLGILGHQFYAQISTKLRSKMHSTDSLNPETLFVGK